MNTGVPSQQKKRSGRAVPFGTLRGIGIGHDYFRSILNGLRIVSPSICCPCCRSSVYRMLQLLERASQLQRIVDLITIALRKCERALVRGNHERLDFAQGADGAELFVDLAQGCPNLRRATLVNSLSACTLMSPPSASRRRARSARGSSGVTAYRRTLVSKNGLIRRADARAANYDTSVRPRVLARLRFPGHLPLVGSLAVEPPASRKFPIAVPQDFERPLAVPVAIDCKLACARNRNSISSPSLSWSASTTACGRRIARLLPHFETCIDILADPVYHRGCRRVRWRHSARKRPRQNRACRGNRVRRGIECRLTLETFLTENEAIMLASLHANRSAGAQTASPILSPIRWGTEGNAGQLSPILLPN